MGRNNKVIGHLISIEWSTQYKPVPDGCPRVMAAIFVWHEDYHGHDPDEIRNFPNKKPGDGWAFVHRAFSGPMKSWSNERKAKERQRRLRERIEKRTPMFAEQMIAEQIARKPDYYLKGVSEGDAARQAILDEEGRTLEFWRQHVGELMVYGEIPDRPVEIPPGWFPWRDKKQPPCAEALQPEIEMMLR